MVTACKNFRGLEGAKAYAPSARSQSLRGNRTMSRDMPLQCNIDAKGKLVRLIYGTVFLVTGIVLMFAWAMRSESTLGWIVSYAS